ncbi:MAG: SHOCT domain-containing protein [Betaproteobacteria bacterium]|nr:SHOCT domain-containing protein [Betaproteobacteria bacterium]MDH5211362.1 SHOCT domain-containing protein [Betaproteobacteria bacterium]MDH5579357.1 SHOCT domain-containing protein [Betaproteobacteria bacterium]
MMFGYDGFGFGGGMGFGMLLFWGLIVAAIVVLVRGIGAGTKGGETRASDDTPLSILRQRFARGEIDTSEFEAMRRELSAR